MKFIVYKSLTFYFIRRKEFWLWKFPCVQEEIKLPRIKTESCTFFRCFKWLSLAVVSWINFCYFDEHNKFPFETISIQVFLSTGLVNTCVIVKQWENRFVIRVNLYCCVHRQKIYFIYLTYIVVDVFIWLFFSLLGQFNIESESDNRCGYTNDCWGILISLDWNIHTHTVTAFVNE